MGGPESSRRRQRATPQHIDNEPTQPATPGKLTRVTEPLPGCSTAAADHADDHEMILARTDFESSCLAAEMHCQDAIGDVAGKVRATRPRHTTELPWWVEWLRGWITDIVGARVERSWTRTRDQAERMRPEHDALDDMAGTRRQSAAESATGIPIGDTVINFKPSVLKNSVKSVSTTARFMILHSVRNAGDNLNERDAEFLEGLRDIVAVAFTWLRREAPEIHRWTSAQLRTAADILSGPEHSPAQYKTDVLARLESYRASRADEIGEGQEMYGKSKKHLTVISRADGAQRWAMVEWFEPNPNQPTKGIHDGKGGILIVPFQTPVLLSDITDENLPIAFAYQRSRNKTTDNPDGNVKTIEAFDPPTGMPEIDAWRAQSSIGDAGRAGASAAAGAEPTIDTSEVPIP